MFLGTYAAQLSDGGRLSIPQKIRRMVQNGEIILFIGLEHCIFGFNKDRWQEVISSEINTPFFPDSHGRDMRRKLHMSASLASIDMQGRVVIPDMMLKFASIANAITVVGAGDHFEIWDKKTWEDYSKEL